MLDENQNYLSMIFIQDAIRTEYAPIIEPVEASLDEKYAQLGRQHADFAVHIQTQISQIQQQIIQLHQVQQQAPPPPPPPPPHLLNNTFGNSIISIDIIRNILFFLRSTTSTQYDASDATTTVITIQ